jgi:AraC-type DNA-binding domain-containing proteins
MISAFDLAKLNSLLNDFYNLTRIRITVFDEKFNELTSCPRELANFCQLVRTDDIGDTKCHLCDKDACAIAAKRKTPYIYRCHMGLTESIAPLILGNIVIGYLFFGHVFSYVSHEIGWKKIQKMCSELKIDQDSLREACYQFPLITEDYINSASHILQAVASFLCLDRMVTLRQQELPVQIDEFIQAHYTENISAMELTKEFQIGKTQLYEISKQNYGVGIATHIRNLRIEKAKQLLQDHSELTLAQIASDCGFQDYNYFITVFKRVTGIPPKTYFPKQKPDIS